VKKPTVLIVEDESIVALDMQNRVRKLGFEVPAVVSSGEDAIQKTTEVQPDVILMDINLDGAMDGVEAARRICDLFDVPIVYVTAYADEDTRARAALTRQFPFLIKPFEERELQSAIETAIHSHGAE
jgi:CheY-like chemotaxis protein